MSPRRPAGAPVRRAGAAIVAGVAARRLARSSPLRFARMAGSSIAAPDAAGWVTDFLNAAYYARPHASRDVADLRLAMTIVTTRWHRLGGVRRLHAGDVLALHRAFGRDRFLDARRSPRGRLDGDQLLAGAARLIGPWFPEAYVDPTRRGWGIAFATEAERSGHRPELRLEHARVGALSPPVLPPSGQVWHTYAPVPVASAERVVAALARPETWPDFATQVGRFTPLRSGGLAGQLFEIEVVAQLAAQAPVFTRGYVTISRLVSREDPDDLRAYVAELNEAMVRIGRDEPPPVPEGADPVLAFDLTTHEGHFMGNARNRLVLYEHGDQAFLRAAGTWDEMPLYLDQAYRRAGHRAQSAFWGGGEPEESMLHQIALAVE